MKKFAFALALTTALTGCGSLNRVRAPLSAPAPLTSQEEQALINNLRVIYTRCVAAGCTGQQLSAGATSGTIKAFTDAGIALSDLYCDRFFRSANQAARHRKFIRSTSNDVGGLINTVLGVAKASSGLSNGVAAAFAFGDSAFRNYDDSYVVDADLSKMQRLVFASQDSMKREIAAKYPLSVFTAESTVLRYANLCSFLGMQGLLNDSVSSRAVAIEQSNKSPSPTPSATPAPVPAAVPTPAPSAPATSPSAATLTGVDAPPPPPPP